MSVYKIFLAIFTICILQKSLDRPIFTFVNTSMDADGRRDRRPGGQTSDCCITLNDRCGGYQRT